MTKLLFFISIITISILIFSCSDEEKNSTEPNKDVVISSIYPQSVLNGDTISITGTNFGATRGESMVSFDGITSKEYTSWKDEQINVIVPEQAKSGKLWVEVNEVKSNEVDIEIISNSTELKITSITPTSVANGGTLKIIGSNFGATRGNSIVYIGDMSVLEYYSWSNNEIVVRVPLFAKGEKLWVEVNGKKSNLVDIAIFSNNTKLNITSIEPTTVPIGGIIKIIGTNFGNSRNNNIVYLGGLSLIEIDYLSWINTEIVVKVPLGAKSGPLMIKVNGELSNKFDYIIEGIIPETLKEIILGDQVWMNKNLDVTHYRNGDSIPQVTDPLLWSNLKTGAWCYYDNDSLLGLTYGKIYNWAAVNEPRGLAPAGWRVASDDDWKELEMHLGMTQEQANSIGDRSNIGSKLAGGYHLWFYRTLTNHPYFDESKFSALPGGGRRDDGNFTSITEIGVWWTSTEFDVSKAFGRSLKDGTISVHRAYGYKASGNSVRCVKDK